MTRVRDNVSQLSIYILHDYTILFAAQAIFYGDGLSLKLLSLYSKLSKDCTLWSKASLKRWLEPQIVWLVFQVDLACTPNHPKVVSYASR
jgi:hypothetical protein